MSVLASDIISLARANLSDTQAQGRYSDASMLLWTSRIVQEMVRRLAFPESRVTVTGGTVANTQEYAMPEPIRTLRVYVAGQLIVPSNLQTLEGHQIQLYDQSGNTGPPAVGTGGPTGNVGTASPGWTTQVALTAPVLQELGYPAPDAMPWYQGSRPRFYWRSGGPGFLLGLVPAPLTVAASIAVDGVFVPAAITTDSQALNIPDSYVLTAARGVEALALGSDRDDASVVARKDKVAEHETSIKELRAWIKRFSGDSPRGPKMFTALRSFYTRGAHRNSGFGSRG